MSNNKGFPMFADYSPGREDGTRLTLPQALLVRPAMLSDIPGIAQLSSDRSGLPFDDRPFAFPGVTFSAGGVGVLFSRPLE